jgi:hypothetical protein
MYLRDAAAGASDSSLPPGNSVIAPATISKEVKLKIQRKVLVMRYLSLLVALLSAAYFL